jgi:hypothetical protein
LSETKRGRGGEVEGAAVDGGAGVSGFLEIGFKKDFTKA